MPWRVPARKWIVTSTLCLAAIGAFALTFHPSRLLYIKSQSIEVIADDGIVLHGTLSVPRWTSGAVPAVVLVHGSGPVTRRDVIGDTRRLVWHGLAVLAYDKRGAGQSGGTYLRSRDVDPGTLLRRLAADAAAAFDRLVADPAVDPRRAGFFGASQAGWIIPLAAERTRQRPAFHVILSGPAVSTGVEQYYSDLTGDGLREPQVADPAEVERRVRAFAGPHGFDPAPLLAASRVPTLWLLGDRDASVPTFASVLALEAIRTTGNDLHTVIRFPNADHALVDSSGDPAPIWDRMMAFLRERGVLTR